MSKIAFNFKLNTNVLFGADKIFEITEFISVRKYKKIAVIIDFRVDKSAYWQVFKKKLNKSAELSVYFINRKMEPTYQYLDEVRIEFAKKLDCIIGVGGGSTMDVAKAISVLTANKKPAIIYRGFDLIENPGVPLILVPSTAGSGSEITPFAVFIDEKEKRKFGINSAKYLPVLTVIDPKMTLTCPSSVTIASGMDAIIHALESFAAKKHTLISRLFSKAAFPLLFNNIEMAVNNPDNLQARTNISLGAFYAGIALFNSAAGPAGVLSYPLGTLFNVTHGLAGAVFIHKIVEFNVMHGYDDYSELFDLIDNKYKTDLKTIHSKSKMFLECFNNLCKKLKIPKKLNYFGMEKSDIDLFMNHLKLLWTSVDQNPVLITEKDIRKTLDKMID